MTFATRDFELTDWQRSAVDAWARGIDGRSGFGTLEVVTGGGKTLIALSAAARLSVAEPALKLVVVVPTQALAFQWAESIARYTTIPGDRIGVLGAGRKGDLETSMALVAVLNTAARSLPGLLANHEPVLLIVDEAHRAGAPKFSNVLKARAKYRLGLSATPDREELGEDGEPLRFDEQIVGRALGRVVYQFGLREARLAGWLPEYRLNHHAVTLGPDERSSYELQSRQVDEAQDDIRGLGGDPTRARMLSGRSDQLGEAARKWVTLTAKRKDLLYRAAERHRVATEIVARSFHEAPVGSTPRVILFHERTAEATALQVELARRLQGVRVVLEHSGLSARERREALADFSSGSAPVLVSVKSLIEGIDVPAADTGISVASASSVRQRVQSLGRVLRRSADGSSKTSTMHLLYVDDSVDDLIYGKADWTDLTGEDANTYWRWPLAADQPDPLPGPPREPRPTEEVAWGLVRSATLPIEWPGEVTGQEYSVDTAGNVHNAFGSLIANPQGVSAMLSAVQGRRGGRFRVSPALRLVTVWDVSGPTPVAWLVGQLTEPFVVAEDVSAQAGSALVDADSLDPGADYPGPTDKKRGSFKLSKKSGGLIERSVSGGREFALEDGESTKAANARNLLESWRSLGMPVTKFFVNSLEHAWYEADGSRKFLGVVTGGFSWPDDEGDH